MVQELKQAGLRVTNARLAVLSGLRALGAPASHAEVVAHLADQPFDPATIYRNLLELARAGLARRLDLGDHVWRFEVGGSKHAQHPHLLCTACGVTVCLDDVVVALRRKSGGPARLRGSVFEVQLRGLCDRCA